MQYKPQTVEWEQKLRKIYDNPPSRELVYFKGSRGDTYPATGILISFIQMTLKDIKREIAAKTLLEAAFAHSRYTLDWKKGHNHGLDAALQVLSRYLPKEGVGGVEEL